MPHHHPCYIRGRGRHTDITKNSSPISKTLLLLAMSMIHLRKKGISMWIGGHYSGTPCCMWIGGHYSGTPCCILH